MLNLITMFTGYDEHDRKFTTVAEGSSICAQKDHPRFSGSKIDCDLDHVDCVKFSGPNRSVKIFWEKRFFGVGADMRAIMQEGLHDIAIIETCGGDIAGHVLIMRAEPTTDGRVGLSISNKINKTLFAGVGLFERCSYVDDDGTREEIDTFFVSLSEVYPWRRASADGCAHGQASAGKTTTPVKKMEAP